jgi:hypothetical protein
MGPYTVPNSLSTNGWESGIHLWCNDINDNRASQLLPEGGEVRVQGSRPEIIGSACYL